MNFQQGKKVKKGWREVHVAAGRRAQVCLLVSDFNVINNHAMKYCHQEDRAKWMKQQEEKKKAEIHMEEDTLLVVI